MNRTDVYIDVFFSGKADKGTGTYTVVLEYRGKNNVPVTKEVIGGVLNTTKNRTAMLSCIAAMERFKKSGCEIVVHINNNYVVQAINQNYSKDKNKDLWVSLLELGALQNITYMYAQQNSYTSYMQTQIKHTTIDFREDVGNV